MKGRDARLIQDWLDHRNIQRGLLPSSWKVSTAIHSYSSLAASVCVNAAEYLILGVNTNYLLFQFTISGWTCKWYVVSLPGAVIVLVWLYIYLLAALTSFGRRSRSGDEPVLRGTLIDPYYESRHALKAFFAAVVLNCLLGVVADITKIENNGWSHWRVDDLAESLGRLLAGGAILIFLWRLIPTRPIDVVFFRGFQGDRAARRTLKKLRKALGKTIRLTGGNNPSGRRSFAQVVLSIWQPFFFALGDHVNASAFRHNVFLVGHW
jgi:hypothetical protein